MGPQKRDTYENYTAAANFISSKLPSPVTIGIICGSGLGSLGDNLSKKTEIPFKSIPHFPVTTVKGHAGKVLYGEMNGIPLLCLQGRCHYYEGYPLWKCILPIRVMKLLGINYLIVTNAAGGINPDFKLGDIMMIKDHIFHLGFGGKNPLRGVNEEKLGLRFPSMNNAYDKDILDYCMTLAHRLGMGDVIQKGVYSCVGGPSYETVAELNFLKMIGADAVGMSTACEVIAARHCGIKVAGFSVITNKCILEYDTDETVDHSDILEIAESTQETVRTFVESIVSYLGSLQ